jgi:hypothetical protein
MNSLVLALRFKSVGYLPSLELNWFPLGNSAGMRELRNTYQILIRKSFITGPLDG